MSKVKELALLFVLQFISYFNVTVDMRAVNHDQYAVAAATNMVAPIIAWVMVKKVSSSRDNWGMVAVAIGGVTSTWAGMWLTRWW